LRQSRRLQYVPLKVQICNFEEFYDHSNHKELSVKIYRQKLTKTDKTQVTDCLFYSHGFYA
ncbi:hypothetical protein, partial [Bartonella vinsonii]|uniref:hypothetical protein n=1 Tax=Bartonella vinsonii TaxID=33047 RepID=UPI001ABB8C0F